MLLEQEKLANETRAFLENYGLKGKYVAGKCGLCPHILSKFINHKIALSQNQLNRLVSFIEEYQRRMNSI